MGKCYSSVYLALLKNSINTLNHLKNTNKILFINIFIKGRDLFVCLLAIDQQAVRDSHTVCSIMCSVFNGKGKKVIYLLTILCSAEIKSYCSITVGFFLLRPSLKVDCEELADAMLSVSFNLCSGVLFFFVSKIGVRKETAKRKSTLGPTLLTRNRTLSQLRCAPGWSATHLTPRGVL